VAQHTVSASQSSPPKVRLSWRRHGPVSLSSSPHFPSRRYDAPATANPRLALLLNKVREVTAIFWVIKFLSTTVGETGADYLAVHVGLGASTTAAIMVGFLFVALAPQLRARSYVPWIYWLTVVLVSVVGTQITDLLTDKLEISLYLSTAAFACTLAAIFAIWYGAEQTLSIQTIVTTRREIFYWAAILLTFALGTAAGDLATEALGLGFQFGVLVFAALIALIAFAYYHRVRAARRSGDVEARRFDAVPRHRRRRLRADRQGRSGGRQNTHQGPRNPVGRCGGRPEATRRRRLAHCRQGD
jgi:uncharacterized membrane-anchored protein